MLQEEGTSRVLRNLGILHHCTVSQPRRWKQQSPPKPWYHWTVSQHRRPRL